MKLLLQRGADKEIKSNDGRTPLIWAARWGHLDIVEYLLVSGKVNVDERDRRGVTSLMHATLHRHVDAAALLLKHGADPLIANVYGGTAVSIAALNEDTAIQKLLRDSLLQRGDKMVAEEESYRRLSDALGHKIEEALNACIITLRRFVEYLGGVYGGKPADSADL